MTKFIVLKKHSKGCLAIQPQNHPDEPWSAIPSKNYGVDGNGYIHGAKNNPKRPGYIPWIAVMCNSTSCAGVLAVNMREALKGAPTGVGKPSYVDSERK